MQLIVGLGNPGKDYEYTRHNLGFLVVEQLAKELSFRFKKSSFTKGFVAEGQFEGKDVALLLPQTFMNHSGLAVKPMVQHKNIELSNILVVCDDLNLDFGQMRLRPNGSDGGHNGLTSINELLESKEYARLRMGIGHPGHKDQVVDYVLTEFSKEEKKDLDNFIEQATTCCLVWLRDGMNQAMDQFNRRNKNGKE